MQRKLICSHKNGEGFVKLISAEVCYREKSNTKIKAVSVVGGGGCCVFLHWVSCWVEQKDPSNVYDAVWVNAEIGNCDRSLTKINEQIMDLLYIFIHLLYLLIQAVWTADV